VNGVVLSIHITPKAEAPMVPVDEVRAIAGEGLDGDRYFLRTGTYSETPGSGRNITLIAEEALAEAEAEYGFKLSPGDSRRNIMTRGVELNDLVDRDFTVGSVRLRGTRLCEPCDYVEKLIGQDGVTKGLVHRGGLRCDIVTGGTIRVGDEVKV
jgi:MOSC domain-containing protein YiiM